MRTIETTAVVGLDHTMMLQVPSEIAPGPHQVVVVIEEPSVSRRDPTARQFPVVNPGSWPEGLSLRREDMVGDWGR